jgi:hypothetical protein
MTRGRVHTQVADLLDRASPRERRITSEVL